MNSIDVSTQTRRPNQVTNADRAFEVLADGGRRAVIEEIAAGGSATVDDLARRLAGRYESEERARVALVHRHLPKLREADVVTYEPESEEVTFDDAGDVLSVFGAISDRIE